MPSRPPEELPRPPVMPAKVLVRLAEGRGKEGDEEKGNKELGDMLVLDILPFFIHALSEISESITLFRIIWRFRIYLWITFQCHVL